MNSLSVNLHLFLVSFFRPEAGNGSPGKRHKILMEANAFCSDHHVVRSQLSLHGLDHNTSLLLLTQDGVISPDDPSSAKLQQQSNLEDGTAFIHPMISAES